MNGSHLIDFCSERSYVNVLLEILKNRQRDLGEVVSGGGWKDP